MLLLSNMVIGSGSAGEGWAEGLRKFAFMHQGELLGSLYLDLFNRCGLFQSIYSRVNAFLHSSANADAI